MRRATKITMKNYQGATLLSTTDYVGGFVYSNNALTFFGSPEGRVVKKGSVYEYEYAIADHQQTALASALLVRRRTDSGGNFLPIYRLKYFRKHYDSLNGGVVVAIFSYLTIFPILVLKLLSLKDYMKVMDSWYGEETGFYIIEYNAYKRSAEMESLPGVDFGSRTWLNITVIEYQKTILIENTSLMKIVDFTFLFILISSACQSPLTSDEASLEIGISDSIIEMSKADPVINLNIVCTVRSGRRVLLYGITSNLIFDHEEELLCNPERVGAGLCIQIFDSASRRMPRTWNFHPDGYEYLPSDVFIDKLARNKERYLKGTKVLSLGDSLAFERRANLIDFHLKPGSYQLRVIYYSGKGIYDDFVAGRTQVEEDENSQNATAFQGCTISNTIQLVVV